MNASDFSIFVDVDDIQFRLSCGIWALNAVHTAMEFGPYPADTYTDAIFGIYDYLSDINAELRDGIDSCTRKEGAADG